MTNEQILKKAIEKAIKNGWQEGEAHRNLVYLYPKMMGKKYIVSCYYKSIIFSHDFAKAFWGKGEGCDCWKYFDQVIPCAKGVDKDFKWKQHLQQMVLEKEPLKYLSRFLKGTQ